MAFLAPGDIALLSFVRFCGICGVRLFLFGANLEDFCLVFCDFERFCLGFEAWGAGVARIGGFVAFLAV